MKRILAGVVGFIITVGALSACGSKYTEPFKDAPRSGQDNGLPADLIRMPDGFSNAATKCDHGNRVYVVFHSNSAYGSIAVVPQDPSCRQ